MKHVGVYISYFDKEFEPGQFGPMIYKNAGDVEYYRFSASFNRGYLISEKVNLWIDDNMTLDDIFDPVRINRHPYVFRAYVSLNDALIVTDYYQYEDDAIDSMYKRTKGEINRCQVVTQACELNVNIIKPTEYPYVATATMGRKTLMIQHNFHPELGTKAKRYYYPDKSCGPLYPGKVIVTSTFDPVGKPFGFFKGYNPKLPDIDEGILAQKVLDLIKERRADFWRGTIEFCDTFIGQMVVIKGGPTGKTSEYFCMNTDEYSDIPSEPELVYRGDLLYVYADRDHTVIKESISIKDFLSQGYQGCSFDEFQQKFKEIPEFINGYDATEDYITTPTLPVIADITNTGCVTLRTIHGQGLPAYFLHFSIGNWYKLIANFSPDEVADGITHMQETNMNTNRLTQMEKL